MILFQVRNQMSSISGVKREPDESAGQRILRKLLRSQNSYARDKGKKFEPWIPTQKLPRQLTTSASAIRKLQKMGELKGLSVERQLLEERQALSVLEAKKKWHVTPTFSVEYVAYYHDRQNRLDELKKNLSEELKQQAQLREKEGQSRPKFDKVSELHKSSQETNDDLRGTISTFRSALTALCPEKSLPECAALKPIFRALDIVTPNVRAKATIWSNGYKTSTNNASEGRMVSLNSCGICQRTKDQHLLVHCDICKLFYHLGCLTPPLTRMPKKSKLYGWQCSECDKESSSDEMDHVDLSAPRQKRQAAARALVASRNNSDYEGEVWEPLPESLQLETISNGKEEKKKKKSSQPSVSDEAKRENLIANAAWKEERKRQKKMERERRKAEKRRRKEERRRRREEEERRRAAEEDDDSEEEESSENECEIIEDENGQCIVNIRPKPIKLKVKMPPTATPSSSSASAPITSNGIDSNGKEEHHDVDVEEEKPPPAKKRKRSSSNKDLRTHCNKCDTEGMNDNLVRCDECKKCFHFWCLVPPVKKSPKVAGYSWHCNECDPSDVDSDWHLD